MPDLEIDRLLGGALEPTDEFVGSLRAHLAVEWRVVLPSQATSSPRTAWSVRRWTTAAAAVAAVGCMVGGAIYVAGRDSRSSMTVVDETPTTQSEPVRVATIVFDEPTDAWVSYDGTSALYQRDGQWLLAEYDVTGLTSETPVDSVDDQQDHQVWRIGPGRGLVIDSDGYRFEDGVWKRSDCFWCTIDMILPPRAVLDSGSSWTLEYNGASWNVTVPVAWDGINPVLSVVAIEDPTRYAVSVVAGTRAGSTLVALAQRDGSVATQLISGTWIPVGSRQDGLLARRADPLRLDYSVDLLPWPGRSVAPDPAADPVDTVPESAVGPRWVITSVNGVPWTQSTMSSFTVDSSGVITGFDTCNSYNWEPSAATGTVTQMFCDGPVPHAHGPFSFDDPEHLRSGLLVAEAFDAAPPPSEEQLVGWWSLEGLVNAVHFAPDQTVQIGSCPAIGTWTLSEQGLAISVVDASAAHACLGLSPSPSPSSRAAGQLVDGGAELSLRADGSLWIASGARIIQLTPSTDPAG